MPLGAPRRTAALGTSLRLRVFLLIALVNVLVFALGGAFLIEGFRTQRARAERELTDNLVYTLSGTIRSGGELNAARILAWPNWSIVEDAMLVDRNLVALPGGGVEARGLAINPVGRAGRGSSFDAEQILRGLLACLKAGQPVEVGGGRAVPIEGPEGLWGACWYRPRPSAAMGDLVTRLAPWFALSTALLTAGTYLLLHREVLMPVERLARAALRLERGDLAARVEAGASTEQVQKLLAGFNAMAQRIEDAQKNLEAKEQQAREEARRAEAAAMTQRRLAAMGELAAGIAHEINNPLGGLQNAVEVLARPDVGADKRARYLALLRDGLERIERTVSQLLRFTPRPAAPAGASLPEVDLCAIALDALALHRHRASRAGIALCLLIRGASFDLSHAGASEAAARQAGARLPRVRGAQHELGQVALNLISNALDALEGWTRPAERPPERGARGSICIELAFEERRRELSLAVQDDGPGVPAELLPRIADLFYTTKEVGKGTGLGLPIVHSVVAAHGGRVEITSPAGRGLRVAIALPAS